MMDDGLTINAMPFYLSCSQSSHGEIKFDQICLPWLQQQSSGTFLQLAAVIFYLGFASSPGAQFGTFRT
jgi:hypothetical protein